MKMNLGQHVISTEFDGRVKDNLVLVVELIRTDYAAFHIRRALRNCSLNTTACVRFTHWEKNGCGWVGEKKKREMNRSTALLVFRRTYRVRPSCQKSRSFAR